MNEIANQETPMDQAPTVRTAAPVSIYASDAAFESAQRRAKSLAASTLVPPQFQGNMPNCLIALELAGRLEMSPFMVLQNVDVIHGRPFLRAQFIVAIINASRRFKKPLMFQFEGEPGTMERTCIAWTVDRDGDKIEGMPVSLQLAKDEGWIDRKGSKWTTMPELMLRYRAATFFGRLNCPDLLMGFHDEHEVIDIPASEYEVVADPTAPRASPLAEKLAGVGAPASAAAALPDDSEAETEVLPAVPDSERETVPAGSAPAETKERTQQAPAPIEGEAKRVDEAGGEDKPAGGGPPFTEDELRMMIDKATELEQLPEIRDLLRDFPKSIRDKLTTELNKREAAIKQVRGEDAT